MSHTLTKVLICILYTTSYVTSLYADDSSDFCSGLLNISNSPSNFESPCSVPLKHLVLELNYVYQKLNDQAGIQQNAPNAAIRIGLPSHNEFFIGPPTYISQTSAPKTGSSNTYFGLKHTINYSQKWVFAVENIIDTAGGSYAFGAQSWGTTFNAIANYNINDQFSLGGMLGISRQSDPEIIGGRSFNSVNPNLILSYTPNDTLSLYAEVYGQSKIAAALGAGFNVDAGLLYLFNPNILGYICAGQQLYNYLGDFTHYLNFGVSIMI
jgi:hypothetical protein